MNLSRHVVGRRIREFRMKRKLSGYALAQKAGMHPANLRKYEMGERMPLFDTLLRILDAMDVSMDEFQRGKLRRKKKEK